MEFFDSIRITSTNILISEIGIIFQIWRRWGYELRDAKGKYAG